jgi:hypothetical protein
LLPARLSLSRLDFTPGAEVLPRTAAGPILVAIERGTLTIYLDGEPAYVGPGSFALVQRGQRYSLENETGAAAVALKLAVDKLSGSDAPVMRTQQLTPSPGASALRPTSTGLFSATIDRLPPTTMLLFIGCAEWAAAPDDGVVHQHPGAVALRMISGSLRINDGPPLSANGCRFLERFVPYRLAPGAEPPTAFLFGVIPENQRLWLTEEEGAAAGVAPSGSAANVRCD